MDHYPNVTRFVCLALGLLFTPWSMALGFITQPEIRQNPNPAVPLAALVYFKADQGLSAIIEINDGERQWEVAFPADSDSAAGLMILGMRANREHHLKVMLHGASGQHEAATVLHYTTPPLPDDSLEWPPIQVVKSQPSRMEPGVTIVSVRRRIPERANLMSKAQLQFNASYGVIVALDAQGQVVWYYQAGTRIAGIDRLANGNIIFHNHDFRTVEIDMLGNKVREFYAELRPYPKPANPQAIPIRKLQTLHHQPHQTPMGTFLSFSANQRRIENWYASEYDSIPRKAQTIMGDTIVEFDNRGEVLWSWNAFDYLDIWRIGYETFDPYWITRGYPDTWDWSHGNGVSYDPEDDSVIASFKLQDAIIKIDRASGDIKWIFGDPTGWNEELSKKLLRPIGEVQWPYHMHNPRWTHKRTLLVFNNNKGQAMPFDGRGIKPFEETLSHVIEYQIDEENRTVRQLWTSETTIGEDSCVSPAMSEAHRLPTTNNILAINAMCAKAGTKDLTWNPWDLTKRHQAELPRGARIREYTHQMPPEVVYELRFDDPHDVLQWEVYGGFRTPSLYPQQKGVAH